MLHLGEIDATNYTARMPSTFTRGSGSVKRLFEDYQTVEREYYLRTKIFPIMHTLVIRRTVYDKYPWVAQSLYKAFVYSQREIYQELYQTAALKFMLPWLIRHVEETRATMGQDFWPYGFEPNVHTLSTFLRYHHEQGLSLRQLTPAGAFLPSTGSRYSRSEARSDIFSDRDQEFDDGGRKNNGALVGDGAWGHRRHNCASWLQYRTDDYPDFPSGTCRDSAGVQRWAPVAGICLGISGRFRRLDWPCHPIGKAGRSG